MMQRLIGKFLILALAAFAMTARADLVAIVDRTVITDAAQLTLTIRASGAAEGSTPDFSPLQRDFNILSNTSRSNSSISIVNGRTTSIIYTDHVLTLRPNRLGDLTIPSIRAGTARTQPIGIRVQRQSASQQQRMRQFVFFETEVDTSETYVQAQIIYSVKLFYTDAIGGDFPQPPVLQNAVVETIEDEKRYESITNGRRYYVLEKRYAIFPQSSGALVIPRERFSGTRGRGGMFSQRQRVSAVSDLHTITVKRIPRSFSGENWIPAKELAAKESWAITPPIFRVGEPINRALTISAIGISDALLPQLTEQKVESAKVYADPPTSEKRVGEDGLTALQITTLGVVPTQEGSLTLPEIRIPWWNTQTDKEEIAIILAATYQVLPSIGPSVAAPTVTIPLSELVKPVIAQQISQPPYWQWAAIALGLLWLISTWQWFAMRRQVRALESAGTTRFEAAVFDDPDGQREYKAFQTACKKNLASEAHRQLFLWAKAKYPEIQSVTDLSNKDAGLSVEIGLLESHLYGGSEAGSWQGSALLAQTEQLRRKKVDTTKPSALEEALNPI